MANIFDKYGIKEVADVMFYEINDDGTPGKPVLYLDTLKVSTIEQTAEEATANGGKGNPPLVMWDYGKEITVTLEDALFSAKSMALMFGDSEVSTTGAVYKVIKWTSTTTESSVPTKFAANGKSYSFAAFDTNNEPFSWKASDFTTTTTASTGLASGDWYSKCKVATSDIGTIDVNADTFPGTYYITGDTYARSMKNGEDEFFQFVIPKAKVQSDNTLTLEADGDPSVFNLNLRVLRPETGPMMQLIKYNATAAS